MTPAPMTTLDQPPTITVHAPTVHADGTDEWATCPCGWTSSMWVADPATVQAGKHRALFCKER